MAFEKSIHEITNFDYPLNSRRCTGKKKQKKTKKLDATISFVDFSKAFDSLHRDGANTSRLRPTQRNRRSHNDAI